MDKYTKMFIVITLTWGFIAGMYMLMWPKPQIEGCIIALFAAVVVGMFYAKGD